MPGNDSKTHEGSWADGESGEVEMVVVVCEMQQGSDGGHMIYFHANTLYSLVSLVVLVNRRSVQCCFLSTIKFNGAETMCVKATRQNISPTYCCFDQYSSQRKYIYILF